MATELAYYRSPNTSRRSPSQAFPQVFIFTLTNTTRLSLVRQNSLWRDAQ